MIRRILLIVALALGAMSAQAQTLSDPQITALRAAVFADQPAAALLSAGNSVGLQNYLNDASDPACYLRRVSLSRHEILTGTSDDGTTFSWAGGAYITRSQGERDAFREMFNSTGTVNPSLTSIQAAFGDIFSGAGGLGNRTHIIAMSRRVASRAEKMLSTGACTKAAPATATFEGAVLELDARRLVFRDNGTIWTP